MWWWLACHRDTPEWDAPAPAIVCATGAEAPLLEQAALDAGVALEDIVLPPEALDVSDYAREVRDPFALPWVIEVRTRPLSVQCHAGQTTADLDHAVSTPHPVASALAVAYGLLEHPLSPEPPLGRVKQELADLSPLPHELAQALGPVLVAMQRVADARHELERSAPAAPEALAGEDPLDGLFPDQGSWLLRESHRQWALEQGPSLYDPARLLAFAVEEADLGRFAGLEAELEVETELGRIVVAGPGSDAPGDQGEVALYLDLGGDDLYVHPAGASGAELPVSLHLDLGGNDTYDAPSGQGAGRYGVGMLFDWGAGRDRYTAEEASQGWGQLGVGVLFDDGGDDAYDAADASQGAASLGVGLLVDLDGHDTYELERIGQGFGGMLAAGIAYDAAGNDTWQADPGPIGGGQLLWDSGQLPGEANQTFAQGAAAGVRNDDEELYLSGGVGILRDQAGQDTYLAGVYGQGFGYWQSAGYLLEGGGADTYDAAWHAQGASAHFGVGAFLDQGPEPDHFGTRFTPVMYTLGAVSDLAVAVAINEGGDDSYVLPERSAGTAVCQGSALFVDNDGADTYRALSTLSAGAASHFQSPPELTCGDRRSVPTLGLFLDSGGDEDQWLWPSGERRAPSPADNSSFGWSANATEDERAGAVDGDGESGQHATGTLP